MTKFHILKWLYKHSPINFYTTTSTGETVIKSINSTSTGYKYNRIFEADEIKNLRKIVKNFKRFSTVTILICYIAIVYGFIFPNYNLLEQMNILVVIITLSAILIAVGISYLNSKIFEKYLKNKFGDFEKSNFPYNTSSFENQSYKEFKFELVKIFLLLLFLCGIYFYIGSPYETSKNLVEQGRYKDAIKMSTIWSKLLPMEAKWYSLRAYSKFNIQDYEGAINDYDIAYTLENDEYKFMNFDNKIYIRYYLGDYEEALKEFNEEIKNADNDFTRDLLLWDKAQFLYNIQRYSQALKIYNKLLINSESDRVYLLQNRLYYERSQVYEKLGKQKDAQKDMQEAEKLNLEPEFENNIPEPTLLFEVI
ncbi:hypothetical protein J6G99_06050 [bacterium]|nr:hypothetical protein [bacterium]